MAQPASASGLSSFVPISEVTDQLTTSIACRLDPEEQKQAAEAERNSKAPGSQDKNQPAAPSHDTDKK